MDKKVWANGNKFFSNFRKHDGFNERNRKRKAKLSNKNHVDESGIMLTDLSNVSGGVTPTENQPTLSSQTNGSSEEINVPPRVKPERRYSREKLIELSYLPLCRKKPPCLESAALKWIVSERSMNKPLWEQSNERKRGDSTCDEDKSQGSDSSKRRVMEPRERLRKETDVVLSPQRRSFNSGCFVSLSTTQNRNFSGDHRSVRPESPAITKDNRDMNHMVRDVGSRRIGSGRIMARDPVWDYRETDVSSQEHFRNRDDRFEKRTFDRRNDHDKDKYQRDKVNNCRYNSSLGGTDRRRTLGETRSEEEPEWFSGGPTSQHDTIELRGFEDVHEEKPGSGNKKQNKKSNARSRKNAPEPNHENKEKPVENPAKKSSKKNPEVDSEIFIDKLADKFSEMPVSDTQNNKTSLSSTDLSNMLGTSSPSNEFNFDDFLKNSENVVGLLSDRSEDEDRGRSKFSKWFTQESSETTLPDPSQETSIFGNMLSDLTAGSEIKPETDTYFTPISPAAAAATSSHKSEPSQDKSNVMMDSSTQKSSALLEMLQGGARNQDRVLMTPSLQELEKTGKIHSVEELEAKLRRPSAEPLKDQDNLAAFKKLLTLAGAAKPRNSMPDQSEKTALFQMLNKANTTAQTNLPPQHKDQSGMLFGNYSQQNYGSSNIEHNMTSQQQMQIPQDLVMKLLHVQQQQQQQQNQPIPPPTQQQQQQQHLAKLLSNNVNTGSRLAPGVGQFNVPPPLSPLPPDIQQMISNAQPTAELLQRPEAQALLIGLKRGQITLYNLVEQLKKSSAIQPRHREVLACVIKIQLQGVGAIAAPPCDNPPSQPHSLANSDQMLHQILLNQQQAQHQQQQLRIPSPHNSLLQRVPSPRELVVHTQNIMQSALIKKKLEEQRENYRKRQELQRSHSPNVAPICVTTTSTSPLAFTPTSVLRKMTAEKEPNQSDNSSKPIVNADSQNQIMANRPTGNVQPSQTQLRSNSWDILKQPHKGRPIVKGSNNNFNYQPPGNTNMPTGMEFPHQFQNMTRNKLPTPTVQQNPTMHYNSGLMVGVSQSSARIQAHLATMQAQQRNVNSSLQQILLNPNYGNNVRGNMKQDCRASQPAVVRPGAVPGVGFNQNPLMSGVGVRVEPSTSPVSNQLARWFSPELLAQARAGQLPDMSPTQNMLSVEELERLQQQAVPN